MRYRRGVAAHELLTPNPPWSGRFPAFEARLAVCLGVEAHRSSLRSSLPERVRGSGALLSETRLGTL